MSKFTEANKKIEEAVVDSYCAIENGVVDTYHRIENRFVDLFLRRDGETIEETKVRLQKEQEELKNVPK